MPISNGCTKAFINTIGLKTLHHPKAIASRFWCTSCGREVTNPEEHTCKPAGESALPAV